MYLHIDRNYQVSGDVETLRFKRGDSLSLSLIFAGEKGKPVLPDLFSVVFGAKAPGDYSGNFLVYADQFCPSVTSGGKPTLESELQLNSTALSALMGEEDYVELMAEFEFSGPEGKLTSQTLRFHIDNDLIKNTEGLPLEILPEYVTKSYVDATIGNSVTSAVSERENVLRELSGKAEDASLSAANSARSAKETAEGVDDAVATVTQLAQQTEIYRNEAVTAQITAEETIRLVEKSKPVIKDALDSISVSKQEISEYADSMGQYVLDAASARGAALDAEAAAKAYKEQAEQFAGQSLIFSSIAETARDKAQEAVLEVKNTQDTVLAVKTVVEEAAQMTSESVQIVTSALSSAEEVLSQTAQAAQSAVTAAEGAVTARDACETYKDQVQQSASEATAKALAAGESAAVASASEQAALESAGKAKASEEAAIDAASKAIALTNTEGIFLEIENRVTTHNENANAHKTEMDKKLNISVAASTYATKTELGQKIDISTASTTYATKTEVTAKLDTATATSTYATRTELGQKLDTTTASSTYATKSDVNLKLDATTATLTYATKTELGQKLDTTAASSTYATKIELGSKLDTATATSTYATKTELGQKLDTTTASSTYATKSEVGLKLDTSTAASTYIAINAANTLFREAAPPGSISFYAGNTPPQGWLECNGATLARTAYAALYAVIGTTFGYTTGSDFKIPDLRGYFLRGWDNGRGLDAGRTFGSTQGDAIRNIEAMFRLYGTTYAAPYVEIISGCGATKTRAQQGLGTTGVIPTSSTMSADVNYSFGIDTSKTLPTAAENRPCNTALLTIIKY